MKKHVSTILLCLATLAAPVARAAPNSQSRQQQSSQRRHVDVVLALDTSSSMDGLVDAARQKLWDVVTVLSKAQPQPILRVGIISYGNTGYDAQAGWVREDIDLSSDLDSVYGKLFALRTNGGDEYVARAVQVAVDKMSWSQQKDALKIVFVAGNEPATQDPLIPIGKAMAAARSHNIFVNTIYCGASSSTEAAAWAAAAHLGHGQFAAIDQNQAVAIATPHDAELARLSAELNKTYVAYGATGGVGLANQAAQDKNATAASAPAAAARAVSKATALYNADGWDLVDATRDHKQDVSKMADEELPADVRALPRPKRAAYIEGKAAERTALQKRIGTVSRDRETFLSKKRAEMKAKPGAATMDDALLGGLRSEAEESGFKF